MFKLLWVVYIDGMNLTVGILFSALLHVAFTDQNLKFLTRINNLWEQTHSSFLKEGDLLEIRCQIRGNTLRQDNSLELRRKPYREDGSFMVLARRNDTDLFHSLILRSDDSGVYFCYFRGQASIMTLQVVSKIRVRNGTVPSDAKAEDPFSEVFPLRTLSPRPNIEEGFMICECKFDDSIHLDMVSAFWRNSNAQNVDNLDSYHLEFWRDEMLHIVGTRLALRFQSLKKESYGRYSCVFDYQGTGCVEWSVYLNVAPILTLPVIPPPPPLLESGLANPRCLQGSAAANLTEQWRHACEVLAYPPVAPSHHLWNWSNAENAIAVIRSTLVQQSSQAMMVFDQLLHLAEDERRGTSDCLGLLVPQNASASVDRPTIFWCYAKNEIGVSGARWPQDYAPPELPSWAVWLLALQALGMAMAATLLWCYCRHHPHRRRDLPGRILRWISNRLPPFASTTEDWGLVAVGPDDGDHRNATRLL